MSLSRKGRFLDTYALMTAYKAGDVPRIIKAPPRHVTGFLIHGSDATQASDAARQLAENLSRRSTPPGEIIRISDQELSQNPGRLSVELQTLPMFGGRPVVWLRGAQNQRLEEIREGLSDEGGILVVEAGNLAKNAKLRQFFEESANLAALPCYGDAPESVTALIEAETAAAGLVIAPEAARLISETFGSNLSVARAEVEKLLLYAAGETVISLDMVETVIADVAESGADEVITAALSGQAAKALKAFDRLSATGFPPQTLLTLLAAHILRLVRVKSAMEAGEPFAAAIKKLRPPLFFKAEQSFAAQCRLWPLAGLQEIARASLDAIRDCRLNPALEVAFAEHLLIRIAGGAEKQAASRDPRARR